MGTATFQKVCRELAGTAWQVTGDAHAVCDLYSIPAGDIAARLGARTGLSPANALSILMRASEADVYAYMGSTLNLCFDDGTAVDPRITFTRASSATYTNSAGALTTAAINEPRIDYNPVTLARRGFLIEEARTNLLTYSEQFDNATWTKARCSVTTNAMTAPDGTTTADKLVEDVSTTNTHLIEEVLPITSGVTYTFSVYVKAAERTHVLVQMYLGGANGVGVNLTNGSVFSSSDSNYTVTSVGNGWYRISKTFTSLTTGFGYFDVYPHNGTTTNYTGDGTSGIYIWGAQLEAGDFPTSYIPTVASQVTRAADVAGMTGSNFSSWYNQSEGTFVCEFDVLATTSDASTRNIFGTSDGTFNNSIYMSRRLSSTAIDPAMLTAGVSQLTSLAAGTSAAGVSSKFAIGFAANDAAVSYGGASASTDSSVSVSPGQTQLAIGSASWSIGSSVLCGHIKSLRYYPVRLANATLQALST